MYALVAFENKQSVEKILSGDPVKINDQEITIEVTFVYVI
jgi:hypothetical protein